MANTTLRAYIEELNALLEREAFEEVIGHCRHILQHFPKNVETYRVLGRALLERGRHQEASDVFQRVLSAIPDDFTAHLGLNSAYEESNVRASVWHLERAYEQQPNNEVIRDELKRLYALRDGKSPEYIQLTRGALARFYLNGRLYDQATAELQSALEQSSDRVDLLLLLARTLWQAEHPIEASEVALRILEVLPHCIEANHILAALWINSGRPAEAEPYVTILEQLDPFLAWETVNRGQRLVPEDAFQIPRLYWDVRAAAALATDVPDWVATIGDVFETPESAPLSDAVSSAQPWDGRPVTAGEPRSGVVPAWLQDADEGSPASDTFEMPNWGEAVAPTAAAPSPADGIPDWLTDAAEEQAPAEEPVDPMAWLSTGSLTPPEAQAPQEAQAEAVIDPMAWLSSGPSTPSSEQVPQVDELDWMADTASEKGPDWLFDTAKTSLPAAEPQAEMDVSWLLGKSATPAEPEPAAPASAADLTDALSLDWLSATPAEPEPAAAEPAEALDLDWLSATPAEPEPAAAEPADALDLDWLSATPAAEPEPAAAEPAEALDLDWLSATPAAEPEPAAAEPADALSLDWLSATPAAEPEPAAAEPADALSLDWLSATPAAEPEPAAAEPAEALDLDWLSATPAEPEVVITPELEPEALPEDDPMAWMKQLGLTPATEEEMPAELVPGQLDAGDLAEFEALKQAAPSEEQPPVETSEMSSEDVLAWLQAPSQPETAPADTLNWGKLRQTDGFGSFAQPGTAPADWPVQASNEPVLEDEWLAAFESGTQPPLETEVEAPAASEAPPTPAAVEEEPPAEDLPLWKRQVVTSSLAQKHDMHEPNESPTWLDETGPEAPVDDVPAWMREDAAADGGDWMSPEAQAQFDDLIKQTSEKASQPRMVSDTGVLDPKNTPDWLQAFEEGPAPAPAESIDQVQPEIPDAAAIPDWLHEFAPQDSTPARPEGKLPLEALDFSSLEMGADTPVAQPADLVNTTGTQDVPPKFAFDREPAWKRRKKAQPGDAPR